MLPLSDQKLLHLARQARLKALAKQTGFKVGAALLAKSGKVYLGSNIECDIPSLSMCADRAALIQALNAGEKKFLKIALVTETKKAYPCGACAQMLLEFCGPNLEILSANLKTNPQSKRLAEFLPLPYKMER